MVNGQSGLITDYCEVYSNYQRLSALKHGEQAWVGVETIQVYETDLIIEPLSWSAEQNIWVDTSDYGYFNYPSDVYAAYTFILRTEDSKTKIDVIKSPSTDLAYLLFYDKQEPFSDANGEHYGIHPCRAYSVSASTIDDFWGRLQ